LILEDFKLDGKVAVVTGAATGLGQALALGLAEAGADILGVGHTTSLDDTQKSIEKLGRSFVPFYCDVTERDSPRKIINAAVDHFGHVDILVNNAGILKRKEAENVPETDWDEVIRVNLRAPFFLAQAAARQMIKQGSGGRIINICSMLSYSGGILVASYTASKSGLAGLTRILANEWAKYGITVNGIAPGYMETRVTKPLRDDPVRNKEILSRIPLGRWGRPSDLKGAVVFLASAASNYVTGTILRVDGGWLTR